MIAKEADGFIYLVSSLGVTGTRSEINTDLKSIVEVIRQNSSVPCAIGFGILSRVTWFTLCASTWFTCYQ